MAHRIIAPHWIIFKWTLGIAAAALVLWFLHHA
jgi:hypothetical protein